jgi:integrase
MIPIPEALSEAFRRWREQTPYCADGDWVFASPATSGRSPYWFDSALYRQLQPAAERAKITKHIGWHTFRRSLATLLTSKKETVKVVQELMRHADPRIAMEAYAQGEEQDKRAAQEHVSGLFLVEKIAS